MRFYFEKDDGIFLMETFDGAKILGTSTRTQTCCLPNYTHPFLLTLPLTKLTLPVVSASPDTSRLIEPMPLSSSWNQITIKIISVCTN